MTGTRLPWLVFLAIVVVLSISWWRSYDPMPERMASHFNAAGVPNGWMPKNQFLLVNVMVVLAAAFSGFYPARMIATLPSSKINLPNKEYWLSPAHSQETIAYFAQWFAWFGCALLLLLMLVMQLVIAANRSPTPTLPVGPVLTLVSGFLLFVMGASVGMVRRFSKTGT